MLHCLRLHSILQMSSFGLWGSSLHSFLHLPRDTLLYRSPTSKINEMICCTLAERVTGPCTGQVKAELLPTAVKLDQPIALAARAQPVSLASWHKRPHCDWQWSRWQRWYAL